MWQSQVLHIQRVEATTPLLSSTLILILEWNPAVNCNPREATTILRHRHQVLWHFVRSLWHRALPNPKPKRIYREQPGNVKIKSTSIQPPDGPWHLQSQLIQFQSDSKFSNELKSDWYFSWIFLRVLLEPKLTNIAMLPSSAWVCLDPCSLKRTLKLLLSGTFSKL